MSAKTVLTTGVALPVLLPLLPVVALAWAFSVITGTPSAAVKA